MFSQNSLFVFQLELGFSIVGWIGRQLNVATCSDFVIVCDCPQCALYWWLYLLMNLMFFIGLSSSVDYSHRDTNIDQDPLNTCVPHFQ
jgi:hypothetical protein